MSAILHQFSHSHFNEKARWALTYKSVPHERRTYLPGPHVLPIRRLSGQAQTPVLQVDRDVVAGSANIIEYLERTFPEPCLYPQEAGARARALDLQAHLDRVVGPAVRTVLFSVLIRHPVCFCATFADQHTRVQRIAYRAAYPLAKPVIARANGVTDSANVTNAFALVETALDDIGRRVREKNYLEGAQFTVADLTAAALLAPLAGVVHRDMALPGPLPDEVARLLETWAAHPAIHWVNDMYRTHRG